MALRHVSMMAAAYPDSRFEIVLYSGSLPMVIKTQSRVALGMTSLLEQKNVSVKVCKATMDRYKVDLSQLFKGVEVVPDGILEIVQKQSEGWGYIKEAN
jgi:intracellular sulfur oxidation DsrE/DsrF family protein